ncbi:hypothetical protein DL95DRAFT_415265 [Leptodontidium sp. 2 PMI_412]|nr:hypothetical protein DL95DRAFT_415265 [Leptodontidium sp. 2 PMI_412]
MHDDEAFIRSKLIELIESEHRDVLIVIHSAGGFLGTSAVQNLSRKARAERVLKGRVVGFVFLSAALVEVRYSHKELPPPFLDVNNETGEMHCVDLKHTLFNDIDEEKTAKWMKELRCQPARGWGLTTKYAGFEEALSVYLQMELAKLAGSRVEKCATGHMLMLSMPDKVVDVIIGAAKEFGPSQVSSKSSRSNKESLEVIDLEMNGKDKQTEAEEANIKMQFMRQILS